MIPKFIELLINIVNDFTQLMETKKPFREEVNHIVLRLTFYNEMIES